MKEPTKELNGEAANEFLKALLAQPLQVKDNGVSYWLHQIADELKIMNQQTKCNCNGKDCN